MSEPASGSSSTRRARCTGGRRATYSEDHSELICGPVTKQRWIYSAGKQLLERVIHAYGLEGQLDYAIIRPFNFIGPRFDYLVPAGNKGGPRVFAQFMSALLTGGPMYLVDGGEQRRSFTHIDDASRGLETILLHPSAQPGVQHRQPGQRHLDP